MLKQISSFLKDYSLPLVVSSLVAIAIFLLQMSPIIYNNYVSICRYNFGVTSVYDSCMKPYYTEYTYAEIGLALFATIFVISLFFLLTSLAKKTR